MLPFKDQAKIVDGSDYIVIVLNSKGIYLNILFVY